MSPTTPVSRRRPKRSRPADETAGHRQALFETNVFGMVRMLHAFLPLLARSAAPVVVNLSSGLSKAADLANPNGPVHFSPGVAHPGSKTAVSTPAVQYAKGVSRHQDQRCGSGYTATDLNGRAGTHTVEEGAQVIVALSRRRGRPHRWGTSAPATPVAWWPGLRRSYPTHTNAEGTTRA